LKKLFQKIKTAFCSIVGFRDAPKTPEDRQIRRYEIIVSICVIFMVAYMCLFFYNLRGTIKTEMAEQPVVQSIVVPPAFDPNYNISIYQDTNTTAPTSISKNKLSEQEFYVGEVVGIKYFGMYGIVRRKIWEIGGYMYEVRWKNEEHDLPTDQFYAWELYRPQPGTVPLSALQ
jgi:hypothetical protein